MIRKKCLLALLVLGVMLPGCALFRGNTLPGLTSGETEALQARGFRFWFAYYPYEEASARLEGVRPIPDYMGWTDHRMASDVAMMKTCGGHGVAVVLAPAQLAAPDVLERLSRLAEQAHASGLMVTISLVQRNAELPLELDGGNLARFLADTVVARHPAFLKQQDAPVLFYDPATIRIRGDGDLLLRPLRTVHGEAAGIPLVRVGDSGSCRQADRRSQIHEWPLPRLDGEPFLRQLLEATDDEVYIQSWNCYRDGSFIEPNSLDRGGVAKVLAQLHPPRGQ